jgi:hypothetical protein
MVKRDMELIRALSLKLEEESSPAIASDDLAVEGYTPEQIAYHACLLLEAGLAHGQEMSTRAGVGAVLYRLTWEGHEFVEAARDESRWRKAMGMVKEKSGSVTTGVLTQLLSAIMKGALGLP